MNTSHRQSEKKDGVSTPGADSQQSMGEALVALNKRKRLVHSLQVGAVWITLVFCLVGGLMMLRIEPSYIADHYRVVLFGSTTFQLAFQGVLATLGVSFVSILFATVLALSGAIARLSPNPVAKGISGMYVSVVRGTPLLIQIYVIYLGLPQIGKYLMDSGQPEIGRLLILDAIPAGILALSLNYGAYMTEIFRAGLQSISYGQREAAIALGMTPWQVLRRIILPQAIRIIIPDIGNQFIAMQKDSALVSIMGVWEITYLASKYGKRDSKYMEMFLVAAAAYWVLTIVSSWFQSRIEKRMERAYER